ncbi:MAG: hypothetical protein J7M08_03665, partial [Planctomycetes bacterium]|nr:hypothetical protein [Planctomycetota bacterium]
ASGKEPIVTVCLLNWARPENLGPLLDSIAAQSVPARVALWNNGDPVFFGPNDTPISEHPLIARHARATRNAGCFPRWWMASMADTEFVCSMDDDLVFADEHVLADAIAACREECPDGIVGFFGWSRVEGKSYKNGHHHNGTTTGTDADIIKGRFMLLRRELLARVPLVHPALAEDDVVLSLSIADGQPGFHRIPARLGHRWRELPQRGVSASARPGHYQRRDEIVRRLLNFYEGGK